MSIRTVILGISFMATLAVLSTTVWVLFVGPEAQRDVLEGAPGIVATPPGIGGPIELVSSTGETVTEKLFGGKYALVFFGYSFCPDVCPTGLQNIATALDKLGNKSPGVVPVFVSVDPERDTPKQLSEYVKLFHPAMVGLTGSEAQIKTATKRFRVYFALRKDLDPKDYLVDHSSFVYLMDPGWKLRAVFSHSASPEDVANALKKLL